MILLPVLVGSASARTFAVTVPLPESTVKVSNLFFVKNLKVG